MEAARAGKLVWTMGCVLLAGTALAPEALAQGRVVQCLVESGGRVEFSGPCRFIPEGGGSFSLAHQAPNRPLYGSVTTIGVHIMQPGLAEVRGLTTEGMNSRWGQAERSRQDPACWAGAEFRICAR